MAFPFRPALVLLSCILGLVVATAARAQGGDAPVGMANGQPITEQQLQDAMKEFGLVPAADATPRQQLEARHRALDALVERRLLAAEAARYGTTPEQIIEAEVESNIALPTTAQVEAYYERNRARYTAPRAQALREVARQLIEASRSAYRTALLRRLKREYKFTSSLEPLRAEVETAGHPSQGPADAPVTIVEFSDFECPFCGALFPALKTIQKSYPDTVRLVYRQFPLTQAHPRAQKAAEASLCAHEQDAFWPMHDLLFGNQRDLTVPSLQARARQLGLDVAAFDACLEAGAQAARIKQDMADAARAGVTGTPTLFINGRMVVGNQPAEIREIIEDELRRAGRTAK